MKKCLILICLFLSSFLFSKESKLILSEIRQLKSLHKTHVSEGLKQKKLNQNLISALKITVKRRFSNYNEKLKNLKIENVDYEQYRKDSFIYYVKFNDLYAAYTFVNDPKLFLQYPIKEAIYEKPNWFNFNQTTTEDAASTRTTTEESQESLDINNEVPSQDSPENGN